MTIKNQIIKLIRKHCILLVVFVLVVTGAEFTRFQYRNVYKNAYSLSQDVASYIDADDVLEYAKTLKTDDNYNKTQKKLENLKSCFPDCIYMYVFVLDDHNEFTYIYDIFDNKNVACVFYCENLCLFSRFCLCTFFKTS